MLHDDVRDAADSLSLKLPTLERAACKSKRIVETAKEGPGLARKLVNAISREL